MEDEKEGVKSTIIQTSTKDGGCDFELSTEINRNEKNLKKSTLRVHCRQISTRAIFEDNFTPKQLRQAGFAGIRSHEHLDKAKNLIDLAFVSNEKDTSLDIQLLNPDQVKTFLNDSDDEEEEDDVAKGKKDEEIKSNAVNEEAKNVNDQVLAIHLVKEDEFMLLQCKLILKQIPRKEVEVLKEIIQEMKIEFIAKTEALEKQSIAMKQQIETEFYAKMEALDVKTKALKRQTVAMKEESEFMKYQLMPIGSIVMWSGSVKNVPAGWALCDGKKGTPDLRNRFIVGAGGKYSHGGTGGNENHSHNVNVASHRLTVNEIPSHSHGYYDRPSSGNRYSGNGSSFYTSWGSRSTTTSNTGGGQPHSHGANCGNASNLPPYYALCFIMLQKR